jgi:RNA polymerase sigma factor (sigma-70 family)
LATSCVPNRPCGFGSYRCSARSTANNVRHSRKSVRFEKHRLSACMLARRNLSLSLFYGGKQMSQVVDPFPDDDELAAVAASIRIVISRFGIHGHERDDFAQDGWLHVLGNPVIRKGIEHAQSKQAYLVTVMTNLWRDMQRTRVGRWRVSAQTRRGGHIALEAEVLMGAHGFSKDEVVETLLCKYAQVTNRDSVERVVDRIRPSLARHSRRTELVVDARRNQQPDDALFQAEAARARNRAGHALRKAISHLSAVDRLILTRLYVNNRPIRSLAVDVGCSERAMYTKVNRLHADIRAALLAQGIAEPTQLSSMTR